MKLSKSDIIATATGLLVIGGLSTLLYLDMTRRLGSGSQAQIGTVLMKRNVAQRKYSAQVVWEEVTTKATLYNFDTVRTDDLSEAIIKLNDGTEITLNENSMILLSLSQDTMDIKFMQGAIQARRSETTQKDGKAVTISGQTTRVAITNGDVSLSRDAGTDLRLTVNRGKATLKSAQGEKNLAENQNAVATGEDVRVQDLALRLTAPAGNQTILVGGATTGVTFSWEPIAAGWNASLEIARDPGFTDMAKRIPVRAAARTEQLASGIYYWRLTARDPRSGALQQSEARKLSMVKHRALRLFTPRNGARIPYRTQLPLVTFSWSESDLGGGYTLEISKDPSMKPLVTSQNLGTTNVAITPPAEGTYYWRVTEVVEIPGLERRASTALQQFTVTKTETATPPEPLFPPDGRPMTPAVLAGQGVRFSWRPSPLAPATRIVIAATPDFAAPLLDQTADGNSLLVKKELAEGTYYWRVLGMADGKALTDPSAPRRFTLSASAGIVLLAPADRAVITAPAEAAQGSVTFSWKQPDTRGTMVLELSNDEGFKKIIERRQTEDFAATVDKLSAGTWFWRVRIIDDGGKDLVRSGARKLTLLEKLPPPVAVGIRGGGTVALNDKKSLDIAWQKVPGATSYRVSLFQQKKGAYQAVMTMETKKTAASFSDLKKLDEGKCLWTIQALSTAPDGTTRRSEEIRVPITVTSGIKDKKIKIKTPKILYID